MDQKKMIAIEAFKQFQPINFNHFSAQNNIPISTLYYWWDSYKENKSITVRKKRKFVPSKITARHKRFVQKLIHDNPQITILEAFNAVRRSSLKQIGISSVRKVMDELSDIRQTSFQPPITQGHAFERIEYCRRHQRKAFKTWIFADEASFEITRRNAYRKLKHGCNYFKVKKAQKEGIMIWGAIGFNRKFPLCIVKGGIGANAYIQILNKYLVPHYPKGRHQAQWIFVHDNAPSHTAWATKRYLAEQQIRVAKHPARSPDLNPIEEIWSDMKREVSKYEFRSTNQLANKILEIWEELDQDLINRRILRLKKKMKDVIDCGGYISTNKKLEPVKQLSDRCNREIKENPAFLDAKEVPKIKITTRQPLVERIRLYNQLVNSIKG